jgi:signal transduction histidine kinase
MYSGNDASGGCLLQQLTAPQSLFKYQRGRVIALGRVMLAVLFLFAVWLDRSEPARAVAVTYALLVLYVAAAIAISVATWRNWWLDARLAVPLHALDMAVFTAIVFSTNGSTSPFFLLFVLPLLSAAIRWGWRETALTATSLILLYLAAGALVSRYQGFELERFVVRSGHLLILSLLLIWFGMHQRATRLFFHLDGFDARSDDTPNPLERALVLAIQVANARSGALMIAPLGEQPSDGLLIAEGYKRGLSLECPLVRHGGPSAFLYDLTRNRALTREPQGRFQFAPASQMMNVEEARELGLDSGLIAEVRTGTHEGWLILDGIADLSTDFVDLGRELGRAVGAILDRQALLDAIEAGAAARTRLALARDVHDSIVQFLAGTTFRVEAIKRAARSGTAVEPELDELKRLLVEEQGEIRGLVQALRSDREVELSEAVAELKAVAERLSQQWSVKCGITAAREEGAIPIRLQLDLQQLLREAVANAVRHGGADTIDFSLGVADGRLELCVSDNGSGFPYGAAPVEPRSLKERVERAHGSMRLVSKPGSTNIHITLPLAGAPA